MEMLCKISKNRSLTPPYYYIRESNDFYFETVEKINKKNIFCMGTVAQLYQDMGGKVIILGKPSQEIYHEAIKCLNSYNKSQMVAVGDSLFHDIIGAKQFGIDSVLITSGIHADYFSKKKTIMEK